MEFKDLLKNYMERTGVTRSELARRSGLSLSTISRYYTGARVPDYVSEHVEALLLALAEIGEERGIAGADRETVRQEVSKLLIDRTAVDRFRANLSLLLDALHVYITEFAAFLRYDPSYISRVRSGQRRPARLEEFASDCAAYFLREDQTPEQREVLAGIIGVPMESLMGPEGRERVKRWLLDTESAQRK